MAIATTKPNFSTADSASRMAVLKRVGPHSGASREQELPRKSRTDCCIQFLTDGSNGGRCRWSKYSNGLKWRGLGFSPLRMGFAYPETAPTILPFTKFEIMGIRAAIRFSLENGTSTTLRSNIHTISVQLRSNFKSEINGAFPCKRHQKQHIGFCTIFLRTEGREVESPRARHSLNRNDLIRVNFTATVWRGNQEVGNSSLPGRATYLSRIEHL
jgi:hypothetical protein